jgi:hypothetical protein
MTSKGKSWIPACAGMTNVGLRGNDEQGQGSITWLAVRAVARNQRAPDPGPENERNINDVSD